MTQMQPMWICICWGECYEGKFENSLWTQKRATHLPGRVISSAEIPSIKHNPWGWNASKILLWIPLIKISGCRCLFLPSSCAEVAGGSQGHLVCPHPLTIFKDQSHTRKVLLLHVQKFNNHDYETVWGNTHSGHSMSFWMFMVQNFCPNWKKIPKI